MYSYSCKREVKFKELKKGNDLLTFSDLLQNIFKGVTWVTFSERKNLSGIQLALGISNEGQYYLSSYFYNKDAEFDTIKTATTKKDIKALMYRLEEDTVTCDNLVDLQKAIHEKVLVSSQYLNDWIKFLVLVKNRFLGRVDFSLLATAIKPSHLGSLFSDKSIKTLGDFFTQLGFFKFIFPHIKVELADEDDASFFDWLILLKDIIDINELNAGDILNAKLDYGEYLDLTMSDLHLMMNDIPPREDSEFQFINSTDCFIKILGIMEKHKSTLKSLAFCDLYEPILYTYFGDDEVDAESELVAKEVAKLFGHRKVKTKKVDNPTFLKEFCFYYVQKEG